MKAAELRQSILQAAVQGKLVPQNKNDEPASELLKRIQAEKVALIKEGKLKKEKILPLISKDEIPYDLPDGWVWCHLLDICCLITDGDHQPPPKEDSGIPFLVISNLAKGYLDFTATRFVDEKYYNDIPHEKIAQKNDILFTVTGSFGISVLVSTSTRFCFQRHIALIRPAKALCVGYLFNALKSPAIQQQCIKIATGTAQKTVPLSGLRNLLFPCPPPDEQQRIVARVDELMILCNKLEVAEKEQDALESYFAEYLPKSILQAAVQGKLVPQNIHDEPASELLKRIQLSKEQLVKEGTRKKGKSSQQITADMVPYDLPEGWVWCRLSEIGKITGGATPESQNSAYYTSPGKGIPWITPADMKLAKGNFISHGAKDITPLGYSSCSTIIIPTGSIIFSSRAPIGHLAFSRNELCTNQGFKSIVLYSQAIAPWIFYALKNDVSSIEGRASGTTFKEVSGQFMEKELIPFPPLAEQQRIVAKVDELMALCDELKAAYTTVIGRIGIAKVLRFPTPDREDEYKMVAQGTVTEKPSEEHQKALSELLEMMDDE